MKYTHIRKAVFLSRPNRFVANIRMDEETVICHVKNTGRCRELLVPGAEIFVQMAADPSRKTSCDLIAIWKGNRLINMDSQVPNKVFAEWAVSTGLFPSLTLLRPETKYGNSRFDFYAEYGAGKKAFIEVKGVTLEEDGVVLFPDAPTERGVKHIRELIDCVREGYEAYAVFIVQMDRVRYFTPNRRTHPEFADVLAEAREKGVNLLALSCTVEEDGITAAAPVAIRLHNF